MDNMIGVSFINVCEPTTKGAHARVGSGAIVLCPVPGMLTAQLAQLAHLEWNSIFVDTID